MEEVINRKQKGEKIDIKASQLANRLTGPKNIAFTERPNTKDILEKHYSQNHDYNHDRLRNLSL